MTDKNGMVYSIKLNLREYNLDEWLLARYFQQLKSQGIEIKATILRVISCCLKLYAISNNEGATREEIERVFVDSLSELSGEMSRMANLVRTRHGIELTPELWRLFGVLPSPIAPGVVIATPEETVSVSPLPIESAPANFDPLPSLDDDDDEDDAEYLARARSMAVVATSIIKD